MACPRPVPGSRELAEVAALYSDNGLWAAALAPVG